MAGNSDNQDQAPFEVAIVGGGLVGVMTALGLLNRGIHATVYESADAWHEMGVGIVFTGIARQCMQRLDPHILNVLQNVGEESKHEYQRFWDGFYPKNKEEAQDEASSLLFQVSAKEVNYWGCLRSRFLEDMASKLPEGVAKFGKKLVSYVDDEAQGKVSLTFADGETATADLVIGCDGIHSATRKLLLGPDHPSSHPGYSHNVAYRSILPVSEASKALGIDKATTRCMQMGPDAVVVGYPVDHGNLLNLAVFIHDPNEWPDAKHTTATGTRQELQTVVSGWAPHVRELIDLLPEKIPKWAIFDTADNPLPTYASGRVCLAGDAAHGTTPFQGVGACMGSEDALVLSELLALALGGDSQDGVSKSHAIKSALQAYSTIRMPRTQGLVQASRETGHIYKWRHPDAGRDAAKCDKEYKQRQKLVWTVDIDKIVEDAKAKYQSLL